MVELKPSLRTGVAASTVLLLCACATHDGGRLDAAAASEGTESMEDAEPSDMDASSADAGPSSDGALSDGNLNCANDVDGGMPSDLFCTGLYIESNPQRLGEGVHPYTPGAVLWSDGAEKHRYLYLPPGARIDTSNMDSWHFPVGTKAWKEFRVNGALVETRLLWKSSEGTWQSGTYVWDAEGRNATLNTARKPTILDGGYEIPAPKDCDKCHHGGADKLLGVEAVALALPAATGLTLTSLAAMGALSDPPAKTALALPEDSSGKAAAALGYLHANCGMPCHSTRGLGEETQLVLRLRADEFWPVASQSDAGPAITDAGLADAGARTDGGLGGMQVSTTDIYRATVDQKPTTASVAQAFPGALRITRGSHELSLVWQLAHRRGNYQMPPLVSHRIDEVGMQNLADWIDALPK